MSNAQPAGFNYTESAVPPYQLPEVLKHEDGSPVVSARDWTRKRRPELLNLFEREVYGRSPSHPQAMQHTVAAVDPRALGGLATRRILHIHFDKQKQGPRVEVLLYIPNAARGPVPAFLGMNFKGNHAVTTESDIPLSTQWIRSAPKEGVVNDRATEAARGTEVHRWPIRRILERGYAVATFYYGDVDPDFDDGFRNGIHPLFYKTGQARPAADEWGSIAAWAWGLSRVLDALGSQREIDARRVAVLGHSRLGKAALWAGAIDERFAVVISNNSGCGGAALSKRIFGETVGRINSAFPHWFCGNFKRYNDNEADLPVDQHELIALIAPRPVYIASATEDLWADPRGEFLAGLHAEPVYRLLGRAGLGVTEMPAPNQPVGDTIGYHLRSGPHEVTDYDWERYLDFADRHLRTATRRSR